VHPKASWADLIRRTHQHYHRQCPVTAKFPDMSLTKVQTAMEGKPMEERRL